MANFIGVGIHDKIVISPKTKVNEKGTLELVLTKQTTDDLFAGYDAGTLEEAETKLMIFPPNTTDFDGNPKSAKAIMNELRLIQDRYTQILEVYMTKEAIKSYFSAAEIFGKLNITQENAETKLKDEKVLQAVMKRIGEQFVKAVKENQLFEHSQTFRIKLRRQSTTKHYATIPRNGIWVESSVVPEEASKLKFDAYEIEKGLDNGSPLPADEIPEEEATDSELFESKDAVKEEVNDLPFDEGNEISID